MFASRAPHSPALPAAWLRSLFGLTLACLALAASGSAWADPPGRVGRIADTSGNVWLYDDEDGDWVQPRRNRPVTEGDRISAERGARAEVQVGSATLRLDGGTDIEFVQLDDERVHVRLHGGSVALRTHGDSAREFAVLTDEGRYEPLRAGRYRIDVKDNGSFGAATTGALRFEASDSVLDINAGQRAEFWAERGATHYAWASMPDDRFADWVAREEREDDHRERQRYVSPEMTGADDLDRYGRWDRHPEYGAIWWPTTVVAGWSPYRYGHWAYVRPWGWTWVDDAPWGFAPFHYGRWVHWGGRWGWCPGQYVARPVYAPALVAWFGSGNVSVSVGVGPAVGWVPLAPREIYHPTYHVTNIYVRNVNTPHRHWHGRNPRYERAVPTGPIMYTNQGVAGGVTAVPQATMRGRQPISSSVVLPVDGKTVARWQSQAPQGAAAQPAAVPVAPPSPRVAAAPGGALPAAPGQVRRTPWTPPGRIGAARGDGGEGAMRGGAQQGREQRPAAVERPGATARPVSPGNVQPVPQPGPQAAAPALPQRDLHERRGRGRDDSEADDRRGRGRDDNDERRMRSRDDDQRARAVREAQQPERRVVQPVQPVQPVAPAVQPVRPVQPMQPAPAMEPPRVVQQAPGRAQRDDDRGDRGNDRGAEQRQRGDQRGDDGRRGGGGFGREHQNR